MSYRTLGLRDEEFDAIVEGLGREPNETELHLFSVMWSEHCSYKSTRRLLRLFPKEGKSVVQGPGENAGIVDVGDGWGAAFKVESHNHPSAVEPYQGAATGVGGIIRDILAMGARPTASMDGLFFGREGARSTRRLSDGIIRGVGDYGNCVGVPTVGGKTAYDPSYDENPLVNAFCLGLVRLDRVIKSSTAAPGQVAVLIGSPTGRDGIGGAAFASVELADETKSSRPQVQIGDPFAEKLLVECCLELVELGAVVSMQDMGAGGITSSASEVAAKSGVSVNIELDRVPLREKGMAPWEIALSESQERMLLIVQKKDMELVESVAAKWGLNCAPIGTTTPGDRFVLKYKGNVVADVPASLLGGGCPEISWPSLPPEDLNARQSFGAEQTNPPKGWEDAIVSLLSHPNWADKSWIYEQYDHMVQINTIVGPGSPVTLLRIKPNGRFLALVMESDPWKCRLDPFSGGAETVAKGLRALAVCGAVPLGMTDCLNFPSPEKPDQFWELEEAVRGMATTCREMACPVVSGNVSLYNETSKSKILPTPLACIVGLVNSLEDFLPSGRWKEGNRLFLVGSLGGSLAGSAYQHVFSGKPRGVPVPFDAQKEKAFFERAAKTAKSRVAESGRPLAGGGLALALAKEAIESGKGAQVNFDAEAKPEVLLFGEGGPRAIYAVPPDKAAAFCHIWQGFPVSHIGKVGGSELSVNGFFKVPLEKLVQAWRRP